ncbi:MAG: hypothetical protein WBO28_01710 [Flavobacteriales bacterium]|jgi:hypothetical protein
MEALTTTIALALLVGLVASPVVILYALKKQDGKYRIVTFLGIGIIISASLTMTYSWWMDASKQLLLQHYGYDYAADNDSTRLANVGPTDIDRVKSLERGLLGIGWPLKAMMMYVVYFPYLMIVYLISYFIRRSKSKKEHTPNRVGGPAAE